MLTTGQFLDILRERGIIVAIVRGRLVLIERCTDRKFSGVTPALLKNVKYHRQNIMALLDW